MEGANGDSSLGIFLLGMAAEEGLVSSPHRVPETKGVVSLLRWEIPENIHMLVEEVLHEKRIM